MFRIYIDNGDNSRGELREELFGSCLNDYLNSSGCKAGENEIAHTDTYSVATGLHGKPYFTSPELSNVHWSLSHSGVYTAIAFSDSEVGVDIEDISIRNYSDERFIAIAERFFSEDEIEFIRYCTPVKQRFFKIWTAKEAFVKYTGEGMTRGLPSFSVFNVTAGTDASITAIRETTEVICSACSSAHDYVIIDI